LFKKIEKNFFSKKLKKIFFQNFFRLLVFTKNDFSHRKKAKMSVFMKKADTPIKCIPSKQFCKIYFKN